jgi:predicted transcriptional regulator
MTTVHRLADKGLVSVEELPTERRAHVYRAACSPSEQLARASRQEVEAVLERYGEAALAAFADRLDGMSPARRRRLQRLAGR